MPKTKPATAAEVTARTLWGVLLISTLLALTILLELRPIQRSAERIEGKVSQPCR